MLIPPRIRVGRNRAYMACRVAGFIRYRLSLSYRSIDSNRFIRPFPANRAAARQGGSMGACAAAANPRTLR
jgi:hypothetical protein